MLLDSTTADHTSAQAALESGNVALARQLFSDIVTQAPNDAAACAALAACELHDGQPAEAALWAVHATCAAPQRADYWLLLGQAQQALENWPEAIAACERAVALAPQFARPYAHLGAIARQLGQPDAAVSLYRQAAALAPEWFEPHLLLGDLLFNFENWEGAAQCYAFVDKLDGLADDTSRRLIAQSQWCVALIRLEKLDEAETLLARMLADAPTFAELHSNLAMIHERRGRADEALVAARKAIELKPEFAEGYNNLGIALRSLHRLDESRTAFEAAVRLAPQFSLARFNLGSVTLMRGDYTAGWPHYEARRDLMRHTACSAIPEWNGAPLASGRLLIQAEQGYGDSLQFVRFVSAARMQCGVPVVLQVPAELQKLFRSILDVDEILRSDETPVGVTAAIPMASLPRLLGLELGHLPGPVPYVAASGADRARWRETLRSLGNRPLAKRVGLVWQGNPEQAQDNVRSIPFQHLARLGATPNVQWFSLQKDQSRNPALPGLIDLCPLGHLFKDFSDAAAVVAELDLIITVDTSLAHLAGALGKPVWTMLCHTPDWRWHLNRSDSPWYPTMKLFRQPRWGDWPSVVNQVAVTLEEWAAATRGGMNESASPPIEAAIVLELPSPGGALFVTLISTLIAFFVAVAIYNLANYQAVPGYAVVLSLVWLFLVTAGLGFAVREDGGIPPFLVNLLAAYSRRHFVEASPHSSDEPIIRFRFTLANQHFTLFEIPASGIASIGWNAGQATSLAGRDLDDWHVVLWYHHPGAKRWLTAKDFREEAPHIIGPSGPKMKTAATGLALVAFLESAGVRFFPTPGECEFTSRGAQTDE